MKERYHIVVPATSANLGSGFDVLGMALDLYNEIYVSRLQGYDTLTMSISGFGENAGLNTKENLIYQAYAYPFFKNNEPVPSIAIDAINRIPFARGLGSSSAAIVAGLIACQVIANFKYTEEELIHLATELDHHPDNVAPALLGGITISKMTKDKVIVKKITPPAPLKTLAIVPDYEVSTNEARKVLPKTYSSQDAIANLGAISLLTCAFITGDLSLLSYGLEDTLHEPYRKALISAFDTIKSKSRFFGAFTTIISGSGSTMLVFYDKTFDIDAFKAYCQEAYPTFTLLDICPINEGVKLYHKESELKICH